MLCIFLLFITLSQNIFAEPLTLKQALRLALEKNLDIKTAEEEENLGKAEVLSADSVFDTMLTTTADWKDDQDKPASTISGSRTITQNYNLGLTKKWFSGTTFDIQFKNIYKDTNSSFVPIKTSWDPKLEFNVTQPILKNFLGVNDRKKIKIAKLKEVISTQTSKDKIETILGNIAKLYLDFAFAQENIQIKRKAFFDAQRLFSANQKKIKLGIIEETDLIASKANVLSRENDLLLGQNLLELSKEKIKIALQETSHYTAKDPILFKEYTFNLNESLEKALENRKDYLVSQKDLEAKALYSQVAYNSLYPEINLLGTFSGNGFNKEYGAALSDVLSFDFPTYLAGVTLKYPLGNDAAQSEHIRARVDKIKALHQTQKLKHEIKLDIAQKITSLKTLALRAKTSENILKLLNQKMISEEKKFNLGRSSINFVIQFQEDYLNGAVGRIQAILDYEKAVIDFRKSEGTLLEFYLNLL